MVLQEAIQNQRIELKELDSEHLGSDLEYKVPNNQKTSNPSKDNSDKSKSPKS